MKVVGTAGHVDHGKSSLVKALTGIDPDRLVEEQKRQMTIDLGFAWMDLPNGEQVGIIDVPGHRDFIENMLAGVGGIDAVIFVIAADEGVMPQTREHLAILELLRISNGVIALTKSDLVDDEWLAMMRSDIQQFMAGSILKDASIIPVSAKTGQGLEEIKTRLQNLLTECPPRKVNGHPRLPIDRIFSITGSGTVLTGTLLDGSLTTGGEVEIAPQGFRGRIRGLQTHKKKEDHAEPGSRVAVNVAGLDVSRVRRGNVLVEPGWYKPTTLVDVRIELMRDASRALKHAEEIKLFQGTNEVIANVRLLKVDELQPGENGWAQLETLEPILVAAGDRYIMRRPSPAETIGGGTILNPHPTARYRRKQVAILEMLESYETSDLTGLVEKAFQSEKTFSGSELSIRLGISSAQLEPVLNTLVENKSIIRIESQKNQGQAERIFIARNFYDNTESRLLAMVSEYHEANPLAAGISREEVRNKLGVNSPLFNSVVESGIKNEKIDQIGSLLAIHARQVSFTPEQAKKVDQLLSIMAAAKLSPPSRKEILALTGLEVFKALLNRGDLLEISEEVIFTQSIADMLETKLRELFARKPEITVAEFRDYSGTSRKFALAFLEYCDAKGITIREGDHRRLKAKLPLTE